MENTFINIWKNCSQITESISKQQLAEVEKFADKLFANGNISDALPVSVLDFIHPIGHVLLSKFSLRKRFLFIFNTKYIKNTMSITESIINKI